MIVQMHGDSLELGLGLLSIGRVWGVGQSPVPTESQAMELLEVAVSAGIRIFDTAPAYGVSEQRLGAFLRGLSPNVRDGLVIMTKMGEHWDEASGMSHVDHSRDALMRSIDRSLGLLGRIDVLQLHKATEEVMDHADVHAAFDHARSCGVACHGASVSTVEAGRMGLATQRFNCLQFPFNSLNQHLRPLLEAIEPTPAFPIVNRPFAMGAAVQDGIDRTRAGIDAFRFVRNHVKRGIVLTGTGNADHLAQNLALFRRSSDSPDSSET